MPAELPIETTPLRVGHYIYSPQERQLPFERRLENAWPKELHLSIAALGRGVRALRDHGVSPEALEKRSLDLNAYLCTGFELPENLVEVERLADLAFNSRRCRAAVVEAMSILEVGLLQARDRIPAAQRRTSSLRKPADELTMKYLINAVLPQLLRPFDGDLGSVMKRANEAREVRNKVVHKRGEPTLEETNAVLSIVRVILSILELPEAYKGDWKRR